jgi:hemin uptake protein HemP
MPGREPDRAGSRDDEQQNGGESMTNRSETTNAEHEAAKAIRRVRASEVLGPKGILQIEHEGEVYTLRVTRNNRLILTK